MTYTKAHLSGSFKNKTEKQITSFIIKILNSSLSIYDMTISDEDLSVSIIDGFTEINYNISDCQKSLTNMERFYVYEILSGNFEYNDTPAI